MTQNKEYYAHMGDNIGSLYETPEFPAKEKEEVYKYVTKKWKEYRESKSFILRLKKQIVSHPILYNFLNKIRRAVILIRWKI